MGLGIGTGRGGRRVGAGRPKGVKTRWPPEIAAELRRLADGLQRLHQYRRDKHEALQPMSSAASFLPWRPATSSLWTIYPRIRSRSKWKML